MRKYEQLSHKRKGRSLLMIVVFVILLVFGVFLSTSASAGHKLETFVIAELLPVPAMFCDTEEQMIAMIISFNGGGTVAYEKKRKEINADSGIIVCASVTLMGYVVDKGLGMTIQYGDVTPMKVTITRFRSLGILNRARVWQPFSLEVKLYQYFGTHWKILTKEEHDLTLMGNEM